MVVNRWARKKITDRANVDREQSLANFLKSSNTYKDKIAALKFFASNDTAHVSSLFQELLNRNPKQKQDFKNGF
tara:strand:- start:592 stop:813 length:222 start_codon:yes stop_codon:yes gene_type:complete